LIAYSGIGVTVVILLLTNPEVWEENKRIPPRWLIITPVPFFIGLFLLLFTYLFPEKTRLIDLGWISVIGGTFLLFAFYVIFLITNIAPGLLISLIASLGRLLSRIGLSLHKKAIEWERRIHGGEDESL